MKKKVLIICFSNLHNDPRILRQVNWLKDKYDVTTLGISPTGVEGISHINYVPYHNSKIFVKGKRMLRFFSKDYESFYWNETMCTLLEESKKYSFDLIIANDVDTLPLAVEMSRGKSKVIFDAHEYAPMEWEENFKWRTLKKPLVMYICHKYIPKVSVATTVCPGIAGLYEKEFGGKFEVITNASEYREYKPTIVAPEKIKLIYHGNASRSRQTDKQIDLMRLLNKNFELTLMLTGDIDYIKQLKEKAKSFSNVNFLPPVEFSKIVSTINLFDIGLYSLAPTNINNRLALPNKFFEFIQARLAIAISPSEEMARITQNYNLGIVADDFEPESMAEGLNKLSVDDINHFKAQADKSARELSAEKNGEIFLKLIEN
jgi:glycosyltransferase involved in cell wall biosynthesis